jgi:hypothetical protein
MEFYLNVSVQTHTNICCPPIIRANDTNPSFSFYYNQNGRLRGYDFGGDFDGDCFDVVARHLQVNSKNSKAFQLIIHTIAKDFRIHKYKDVKEVKKYEVITKNFFDKKKASKIYTYTIIPRKFNYHDAGYWRKFNISEQLLAYGQVYFAQEIYITADFNTRQVYRYSTKDPAYCYYGGKNAVGTDLWKIYYPLRSKPQKKGDPTRFNSNSSFVQGKQIITGGRVGGIMKAYKDVLALRSFGIQSIAPSAESKLLSPDDIHFMKSHFDFLFSNMDYDKAGIRMMQKLWKHYRIQPIMFDNNYDVKDFAEYVEHKGVDATKALIDSIFDRYKFDMYNFDLALFNNLKHFL